MAYTASGNIALKSDVGSYLYYDSRHPHAVTSVSGAQGTTTYAYDSVGNQVSSSDGRSIGYDTFNKPTRISENEHQTYFGYGLGNELVYRKSVQSTLTRETFHVSPRYELLIDSRFTLEGEEITSFTHQNRIGGSDGKAISVHTVTTDANGLRSGNRFVSHDHLGSPVLVTDESGTVLERYSFDAFGKKTKENLDSQQRLARNDIRGYTGHFSLLGSNIIHMGGRVYDSVLARFLSADPFVQVPDFSQSHNRYAYVLNNPINITDPSGYFFKKLKRWIKKAKRAVSSFIRKARDFVIKVGKAYIDLHLKVAKWAKKNWRTIAVIAVGVALSFLLPGGTFLLGVFKGAIAGAVSSGLSTALHGGNLRDILKSAMTGALTGALTGAIGEVARANGFRSSSQLFKDGVPKGLARTLLKASAHGLVGGLKSSLRGNSFWQGFQSAAASAALSPAIALSDESISNPLVGGLAGVGLSAVSAGVASRLSGGDFSDGAELGAFQYIFNNGLHRVAHKSLLSEYRTLKVLRENGGDISSRYLGFFGRAAVYLVTKGHIELPSDVQFTSDSLNGINLYDNDYRNPNGSATHTFDSNKWSYRNGANLRYRGLE